MTNTYAGSAEYTVPTTRTKRNSPGRERIPAFGNDMQPRTALIPDQVRQAPIKHDYQLMAVQDAQNAGYLREIQDLAAERAALGGRKGHDQATRLRLEQLEAALAAATTDAIAAGVPAADVDRAVEYGRAGDYWTDRPAHRYLGRIAQLTHEMDSHLSELDGYRQRIAELEQRLARTPLGDS
ncbi:hypothetical protein OHA40_01605 [Nocardia sp. NBC_00508]|uniref:hypothetical protein n=1 Tax=Nocardia sp. NBC_00508 TaxID=2975992 RepID=UPI002E8007F4|nr:hypothetical protein [Nocardia sp. NBC_00508]WUD66897.1 hypothetical protein OHA40_01605 [Nocardia sp. NBC_00508]